MTEGPFTNPLFQSPYALCQAEWRSPARLNNKHDHYITHECALPTRDHNVHECKCGSQMCDRPQSLTKEGPSA